MKYTELRFPDVADKIPYDAGYYDTLRKELTASIQNENDRERAIHYSYCIQNLHLNYENKLKAILAIYNKSEQLPHSFYFEPQAKSFPFKKDEQGNKLSEDGLRAYSLVFVHHADMYDMKSLPLTWNNLLQQYKQSFDFARRQGKISEWSKAGQEGCFEGCLGELTDWYLKTKEQFENIAPSTSKQQTTTEPKITEVLDLEEAMQKAGTLVPNFTTLKAEEALVAIKKVIKIRERDDFPDDEALAMLVDYLGFEFFDPQAQAHFEARQAKIKAQDKKIIDCFIKAKNQLRKPTEQNIDAYLSAYRTLLGALREEPDKLEILNQFDKVVKKYSQLVGLAASYERKPLAELWDEYKHLEAELQRDVAALPTKIKGSADEFSRSYCGSDSTLTVLHTALRELQKKMQSPTHTSGPTTSADNSDNEDWDTEEDAENAEELTPEEKKTRMGDLARNFGFGKEKNQSTKAQFKETSSIVIKSKEDTKSAKKTLKAMLRGRAQTSRTGGGATMDGAKATESEQSSSASVVKPNKSNRDWSATTSTDEGLKNLLAAQLGRRRKHLKGRRPEEEESDSKETVKETIGEREPSIDKQQEAAHRRAQAEMQHIVPTVKAEVKRIKKHIKAKLNELNAIKDRFARSSYDQSDEAKVQSAMREIEVFSGQLQQQLLLLESGSNPHHEEARKMKEALHLEKLSTSTQTTIRDVNAAIGEAKENAARQRIAEQEQRRTAQEQRENEQRIAEQKRQQEEQVRQAKEQEAARRRAEETKRAIVAKVNSDVGQIKKDIKSKLRELQVAKDRFVSSPENHHLEQKCQTLLQELKILDGQMQQKILLLQSGENPHYEEAREIKEKLHLEKLATTMDSAVSNVKSAVDEAKEAARVQKIAEQQRQYAAELARQAQEAARIQEEKERLAQEQRRNEQMRAQAQKLQEEKIREEQIRQAAEREAARKTQEKERQAQERALQAAAEKAVADKAAAERAEQQRAEAAARAETERAEQRRIAEEQVRLEQERKRLEAERMAMATVKPAPVRAELKTQNQEQEQQRQAQEKVRIGQARALAAEREHHPEPIERVRQARPEQEKPQAKQRKQAESDVKSDIVSVFRDLSPANQQAVERLLAEFGTEKSVIERTLRDRYQGKRTEKKLKGLLQSFNVSHGRVFTSKRDKQIGSLVTLLANLQKDLELNAHEKGIILSGALQSMLDNIHSTEKTNLFKSRLLTICQEMQTALHRHGVQQIDPSYGKILFHVYEQGDAAKFRKVVNDNNAPRQSIR